MRSTDGRRAILLTGVVVAGLLAGCGTPRPAPVVSREASTGAPAAAVPRSGVHRVRQGDTLYSIAWQHGLEYQAVARWNAIRPPYRIYPGQAIRLAPPRPPARPGPSAASPRPAPVPPATAPRPPPAERAAPGPAPTPRPPSKVEKARSSPPPEAAPPPPAKELEFDDGRALAWRWPAQGPVVTGFAPGDPARKGIDIAGRLGQPVIASEAGRVVYAGDGLIGYGRLVILKHNKNYLSAYGYNRKLLVREGDAVKRGQRLAEMGRDIHGKPRLHFEIRRNGTPVNPMKLLPRNPG